MKLVRKQRTSVSRVLSYKWDIYITHPSRELGDPQGSGGGKDWKSRDSGSIEMKQYLPDMSGPLCE